MHPRLAEEKKNSTRELAGVDASELRTQHKMKNSTFLMLKTCFSLSVSVRSILSAYFPLLVLAMRGRGRCRRCCCCGSSAKLKSRLFHFDRAYVSVAYVKCSFRSHLKSYTRLCENMHFRRWNDHPFGRLLDWFRLNTRSRHNAASRPPATS